LKRCLGDFGSDQGRRTCWWEIRLVEVHRLCFIVFLFTLFVLIGKTDFGWIQVKVQDGIQVLFFLLLSFSLFTIDVFDALLG